jgi:hypothetical protein
MYTKFNSVCPYPGKWSKYISSGIKIFLTFFIPFLTISHTALAQLPSPDRCVSKDLAIISAQLVGGDPCNSCTPGTTVKRTLQLGVINNTQSARASFAYFGTLVEYDAQGNVVGTKSITDCFGPNSPVNPNTGSPLYPNGFIGPGETKLANSIEVTYTCGNTLSIIDVYQAWTDASLGSKNNCPLAEKDIAPKCGVSTRIDINAGVNFTFTKTDVSCFNGTNGSITATGTGGTPPYQFKLGIGGTYGSNGTFNNLAAGTYRVYVKDKNGCETYKDITISQPTSAVTITATPTQILCAGGTGSVSIVTGGGTGTRTVTGDATTNLAPGTYNYTVTDANGCTAQASATINAAPAAVTITATPTQILCAGGTGSVSIVTGGGTGTRTVTGDATTNLAPGTYNYTVTDANGCTAQASATINAAPAAVTITATPTQITCTNGTGSVSIVTGGGTGTRTVTGDATTNLAPGTYNYTVTDANGCTASTSATINAAPNAVTITATPTQILCAGGTGSVSIVTGGGTGTRTVTGDATTNLAPGTYNYTVTDANGCTASTSATINAAPAAVTISATPTQILCAGGTGSVSIATGGGTGTRTVTGDATTNLAPGTYNYTVTDANGCTASTSATINAAPNAVVLTATVTQPTCFNANGSVVLSATGGTGAYTYGGDATSNLAPGTYNYTVHDANGCTATASATLIAATNCITNEGCTPGYWKNHTEAWTGYSPSQTLESVFDVPNNLNMDDITLLAALDGDGGSGVKGAAEILLRAAVAALLNSTHSVVDYPRTTAAIIADVNTALASNNRNIMLQLAKELDDDNNLGCPLNNSNAVPIASSVVGETRTETENVTKITVSAAPNPYIDKVRFNLKSSVTGQGTLQVYNLLGQNVKTVFNGLIEAGIPKIVEFTVPNANRTSLIYSFKVGSKIVSGTLLR